MATTKRKINPALFPSATVCILKGCEDSKKNCKTCGWNRDVDAERRKDIEKNGLMILPNGMLGYIPKEFRNNKKEA